MKFYKLTGLALALLSCTAAHATCQNGSSNWPTCNLPATSIGQGQHQGQGQGQTATGGAATSSATGGNATAGSTSGATANGSVSVSTGGNSDTSRATVWAPVIHGPGAAPIAGAGIVTMLGDCGPRVTIVRNVIQGKRFGAMGGQSDVEQGFDEVTAPSEVPYLDRGGMRFGHQVTTFAAVLGTSSSGSFSLGGFGRSGDGAQGGMAGSGGMQQMVMRVTVRECVMAVEQPVLVAQSFTPAASMACVPVRRVVYGKRPTIKRKTCSQS